MPVTTRPFEPPDADGLAALVLSIQRDEFGFSITYADQPDLQDVAGFFRTGAGEFWVAVDSERVVGSVGLVDLGNGEAALRKMFVHAKYRGSAFGVAQGLLAALLNHARARAIKTIYLGTTEKFHAAHRFYEKSGFRLAEAQTLPANFPRMTLDTRFYRVDLDAREV